MKEISKKDQEESLTREIEIENAFKEFQDAIVLQKSKDFIGAYVKYTELAKRDVINNHYYEEADYIKGLQNGRLNSQPDELSFLSQSDKTIRFLYFRNRGFLYFNILRKGTPEVEKAYESERSAHTSSSPQLSVFEFSKSLFYSMLDDFINCFLYQEADESLLELLYDICVFFDFQRLARFSLEYAKSFHAESDDITSILPVHKKLCLLYDTFLKENHSNSSIRDDIESRLLFLEPIRSDLQQQMEKKFDKENAEVLVKADSNWLDIFHCYNTCIKKHQDKEKAAEYGRMSLKYLDPYVTSESPLEAISYTYLEAGEMEKVEDTASITAPEKADNSEETLAMQELGTTDEVPTEEKLPTPQPISSEKAIQRSSRRLNPGDQTPLEPDNIRLTRHYFIETELFFDALNTKLLKVYTSDETFLRDVVDYIVDIPTKEKPTYIRDFVLALNEWKRKTYTPLLLPETSSKLKTNSTAENDKLKLLDVLVRFGDQNLEEEEIVQENIDTLENFKLIEIILQRTENMHYVRSKIEILEHLLGDHGNNLLTLTKWSTEMFLALKEWVFHLESELCNRWNHFDSLRFEATFSAAVSVVEILIDLYIELKSQIEKLVESRASSTSSKSTKSSLNSTSIELLRLHDRILRWRDFINYSFLRQKVNIKTSNANLRSLSRFSWVSNYFIASNSFTWREKKYVVIHLKELDDFLKNAGEPYPHIAFPNYAHIGEFKEEAVNRRLTTSSILSIFSKILYNNDSKIDEDNETIDLLERILIEEDPSITAANGKNEEENSLVDSVIYGRATLDAQSLKSVRDFLAECPIDLRLSLWNILFLYYKGKGLATGFQKGFEQTLDFVLQFWNSDRYKEYKVDRVSVLLNSLSFYGSYCSAFIKYLSDNKWKLPLPDSGNQVKVVSNLCRIFELCYSFSLHEEASLITGNKISLSTVSNEAFSRFKDFCIESICLILIYSVNKIQVRPSDDKDTMIKDLLILVHSQLGLRRLCDSSEGLFLRFAEDTLVGLPEKPDQELAQLLSCRFHYKVKINDRFPVDHYTNKCGELDKSSAKELAAFILPLCFRHSPLLRAPRNDTKQVIDDLFEIIGEADIESDPGLVSNNVMLEKFLDNTEIDSRFVKKAFYGLHNLDFVTPQTDGTIVHGGIYYLEAVLMFNSYKIRKKSAQSRTVELERIIRLLKDDLIFGTKRIESWILLGQAYGFIVEDDLIWTSDKLNTIDRKVQTANLQRKSLLSYMIAINMITRENENMESLKSIVSVLTNSFAKEFYSALRSPMDMIALKAYSGSKFVRRHNQTMFLAISDKPSATMKFCLRLILRCLQLSIKSNSKDWSSYYYMAKVKDKLKHQPSETLDALVTAIALSKEQGTVSDPLLEAPYKLCVLLYKYVKSSQIAMDKAVDYLNKDTILQMNINEAMNDKKSFYCLIIEALRKLIALDKKGWYHKPHYRIASIMHEEFNDCEAAKDVMSKFFFLNVSNKTFLQMWKPEHERPGKHFVYMFQYTQFYINLLKSTKDISSLVQMLPKLRRANSTMVLLYFAWEKLCSSICDIVRTSLVIKPNYVERFMMHNLHYKFISNAKMLPDRVKEQGLSSRIKGLLCFLQAINDMKKLNNGFGPTSQVDDTLCAIYIEIYSSMADDKVVPVTESPNGRLKRLAKKDFFPFINELIAKFKKDNEAVTKEDPTALNEYIRTFTEESRKRIEEEERLRQEAEERLRREAEERLRREAEAARAQTPINTVSDTELSSHLARQDPGAFSKFKVSPHVTKDVAFQLGSNPNENNSTHDQSSEMQTQSSKFPTAVLYGTDSILNPWPQASFQTGEHLNSSHNRDFPVTTKTAKTDTITDQGMQMPIANNDTKANPVCLHCLQNSNIQNQNLERSPSVQCIENEIPYQKLDDTESGYDKTKSKGVKNEEPIIINLDSEPEFDTSYPQAEPRDTNKSGNSRVVDIDVNEQSDVLNTQDEVVVVESLKRVHEELPSDEAKRHKST